MIDVMGTLMTSMAVEVSINVASGVHDLMMKYKANNIDVVPISEIEKIYADSVSRVKTKDSLTTSLMQKILKGEINGKD